MFPVTDFNFVVAGIATFAATVGYACTRRIGAASSSNLDDAATFQDQDTSASPLSSQESLKRKVPDDGFDQEANEKLGYPDNLANIYPNKRSRTPSSESDNRRPRERVMGAESSSSITSGASDKDIEIPFNVSDSQEPQPTTPEPPRTPSPVAEQLSPSAVSPPSTPTPALVEQPRPIAALPKRPSTPKAIMSSSGGFAAFAGSASPFKPQQSTSKASRPIWTTTTTPAAERTLDHRNESEIYGSSSIEALKPAEDVGTSKATLAISKYTHITGEEEEDVELELKGVKLFVKRGDKSFSDGMLGHVKLLSNRTSLNERILFRREPLWKVSMNIRVHPTVRCSFVPEENVLRIVLKEAVGGTGTSLAGSSDSQTGTGDEVQTENTNQEVVVYALKPGRSCSKHDFKEFAESLIQSSHFKASSTLPSVTTPPATADVSSS